MRHLLLFFCAFYMFVIPSTAKSQKENFQPTSTHYDARMAEFSKMRAIDSTDIVMLGNSLTEFGKDWNLRLRAKHVRNRGIAGDDADGIYHRLPSILSGHPKVIFLMVGINDLSHGLTANEVASKCIKVIHKIRTDTPSTKLYVQSVLPINESFGKWKLLEGRTDDVPKINRVLKEYCALHKISYVDLFPAFIRKGTNVMLKACTVDGLHLTPFGYKIWAFELRKYLK